MNTDKYPWLLDLASPEAVSEISQAQHQYQTTGAVTFPQFLHEDALESIVEDCRAGEDRAFTTDDAHTAYLQAPDTERYPIDSVYNHVMRTHVASIAYDELSNDSPLVRLYQHPTLLRLVSLVVQREPLYLSADPIGCCSINVFRPNYHHSFHFDESEFSTTIMLQQPSETDTGLFQFTPPLRQGSGRSNTSSKATYTNDNADDLALSQVAAVIASYDQCNCTQSFAEKSTTSTSAPPVLHTLDFQPGTLFIFSGSRSLHRVTRVQGTQSRLVAVLTLASTPGFVNTPETQRMFWGRSSSQQ